MAKKKVRYKILNLKTGEYLTHYVWKDTDRLSKWGSYERDYVPEDAVFKKEEEAYKFLFDEHFTTYQSRERSLQILLLVSELAKLDSDIAYKIFLTEDKEPKPYNHVSLYSYLKKHAMFKQAFKAYCDTVAVMKLGSKKECVCFEHFDVVILE